MLQTRRVLQPEPVLPETAAEESIEVEESAEEDIAPEGIGNEVVDEGIEEEAAQSADYDGEATPEEVLRTLEEWHTPVKEVLCPSKRRKSTEVFGRVRNEKHRSKRTQRVSQRRYLETEVESASEFEKAAEEPVVANEPEPMNEYFDPEPPQEPVAPVKTTSAQPRPQQAPQLPLPFVRIPDEDLMEPMRVAMEQIEREGRAMITALRGVGTKVRSNNVAWLPELVEDIQNKLDDALKREAESHQRIKEQNQALQQL